MSSEKLITCRCGLLYPEDVGSSLFIESPRTLKRVQLSASRAGQLPPRMRAKIVRAVESDGCASFTPRELHEYLRVSQIADPMPAEKTEAELVAAILAIPKPAEWAVKWVAEHGVRQSSTPLWTRSRNYVGH